MPEPTPQQLLYRERCSAFVHAYEEAWARAHDPSASVFSNYTNQTTAARADGRAAKEALDQGRQHDPDRV